MPDILSGEFMPYGTPDPVPFDKPWPTSRALVTAFVKMEVKPYGKDVRTTPIGYVQQVQIRYPRRVQGIWELGNFLPIEIVPTPGELPTVRIENIVLRPGAPWSKLPGADQLNTQPVVTGTLLERVEGYPESIKQLVSSKYQQDPMFNEYSLLVNLITAVIPIDIYLKVFGQRNGVPFIVTYRLVEVWPTNRELTYRTANNRLVVESWTANFRYIVVDVGELTTNTLPIA